LIQDENFIGSYIRNELVSKLQKILKDNSKKNLNKNITYGSKKRAFMFLKHTQNFIKII